MKSAAIVEHAHAIRAGDGAPLVLTELALVPDPNRSEWAAVLLHGFAQNRTAYLEGDLPDALLRAGARVFAAELRGHGNSKHAEHSFDHGLSTYLDQDLPAILDAARTLAQTPRVVLVGHSMGGHLGYAHLSRDPSLTGLVTLGSPVILGHGRPAIQAAARLVRPIASRLPGHSLRMDLLLKTIAPVVSLPPRRGPAKELRELFRLANPREADPEAVRRVLRSAEPVSRRVFVELLELICSQEPLFAGVHLGESLARSGVPVIAVIAGRDAFGARGSVDAVLRGPARREIIEWAEAGHVDLSMGRRAVELAAKIRDMALA